MSFEKQTLNYAKQYSTNLAQAYPYVLHFGKLYATPNNGRYRWLNGKTIEIPHIVTSGRTAGDTDGIGAKARRYNNEWFPRTLRNHRKWGTLVHPTDIDFTNGTASIQNITQVYNNEQKFPEMDAYLVSRLYADWRETGRVPYTDTLTTDNILAVFDRIMERMTNKRVPSTGRILYITPSIETMLKNAIKIQRQVGQSGLNSSIDRAVSNIDKVEIEVIPEELMMTAYDFTEGWTPGVTAKQIRMFLVHPTAVITPVSYEYAQLDPPSAGSEGKYDYFEESFEDAFIVPLKECALEYVCEPIDLDTLTFATAASTESGAVAGDCKITVTTPKKHEGDKFYFSATESAPILGGEIDKSKWTEFTSGEIVTITNGTKIAVVEVNEYGRAVAGASGTATSKA